MCCTNNKGANEVCCLLMCLKRQSQQSFNGAGGRNFHAGLALSVLSCPPRHLSHHHSITVCLHYCRGWMNHSWGLSLGSFGGPTLPCLPPSPPLSDRNVSPAAPPQARAHTQTHVGSFPHTHVKRIRGRLLLLPTSYLWQILKPFVAGALRHRGTINCSHDGVSTHGPCQQLQIC